MADVQSLNRSLRAVLLLDAIHARALGDELLERGTPEGTAATRIRADLAGHAAALRARGATGAAPAEPDFSAGAGSEEGPFSTFDSPDDVLRTAQLLHDFAVRVHLHTVVAQGADTTARGSVVGILATASAHAARIRQLRASVSFADVKPWVTGTYPGFDFSSDDPPAGTLTQADVAARVYGADSGPVPPAATAGEDNRTHGGVPVAEGEASTEAFDEPIAPTAADAVLALFIP
ncbi:MAG TPA: ferritin-like domain-containing protein [Longimicrobium sp.]|nr:ferritin-like domain-containing protein [Longimicrobium sp.]